MPKDAKTHMVTFLGQYPILMGDFETMAKKSDHVRPLRCQKTPKHTWSLFWASILF